MNLSTVKSYLLTGAAGIAVAPMIGMAGASVAEAADMPLKAAPPMAAPSWAGWYVGVNIGGASQRNSWDLPTSEGGFDSSHTGTGSAFIGGGQIGYNWQQGMFVYGLEADVSGLSKTNSTYVTGSDSTTYGSHLSWMSTVRGRLGVTVGNGNTLLYGTGGVAFGRISAHSEGGTAGWPTNDYSSTRVGWAAGGGIEYMLTPRWTVGLEGLFADFGSYTKGSDVDGKCCATIRDRVFIGRAKLNYKF